MIIGGTPGLQSPVTVLAAHGVQWPIFAIRIPRRAGRGGRSRLDQSRQVRLETIWRARDALDLAPHPRTETGLRWTPSGLLIRGGGLGMRGRGKRLFFVLREDQGSKGGVGDSKRGPWSMTLGPSCVRVFWLLNFAIYAKRPRGPEPHRPS